LVKKFSNGGEFLRLSEIGLGYPKSDERLSEIGHYYNISNPIAFSKENTILSEASLEL